MGTTSFPLSWEPGNAPREGNFLNCAVPTKGKHFYSSSESEEEEEAHKKFNIKIKPLQAKDVLRSAATVDELKASVGNIALSPSPVVSYPCFPLSQSSQSSAVPRGSSQTLGELALRLALVSLFWGLLRGDVAAGVAQMCRKDASSSKHLKNSLSSS